MMSEPNQKLRLAVLLSGGGTNLQALLDRAAKGTLAADVVVVAADRFKAYGLVRAKEAGIPTHVVNYRQQSDLERVQTLVADLPVDLAKLDRTQKILRNPDPSKRLQQLSRLVLAEQELISVLDRYHPDYICLAGFMRLVSPYFINHYNTKDRWRILNIHPALLPAFPGQHGYEDTLAYGCRWGGVTVHFVDEGEDSGPIIAQAVYPVHPGEGIDDIRKRGLQLEYQVYAQCINWLAAGQIEVKPGPNQRMHVRINDPSYSNILEDWTKQAFSRSR